MSQFIRADVFHEVGGFRENLTQHPTHDDADMKTWLRHLESENPAFKNLFLATAGGALTTGSVSHGWKKLPETRFSKDPETTASLKKAENAEFINKDYSAAVRFYNEALSAAVSARDQAMLLSRIGRNYFKLGVFEDGIKEYRKILQFTEEWIMLLARLNNKELFYNNDYRFSTEIDNEFISLW